MSKIANFTYKSAKNINLPKQNFKKSKWLEIFKITFINTNELNFD